MSAASVTLPHAAATAAERTFEALVREHKQRIFRFVCRLTNDSPDAEDITQEVFVRAFQSYRAFRHDAAVDTWLYRIATNLVIDRARRTRRGPQFVPTPTDEDGAEQEVVDPDVGANPQARVEMTEFQRQVQRAVQSLPVKLRAVVLMHDLEELSYEEVAEALGCPVGTVKSRLFNGRQLLKRKLEHFLGGS